MCFLIPQRDHSTHCTSALILVPTRELADQVHRVIVSFTSFCGKEIRSINLTQKVSDAVQRSLLADFPDIVISTPARIIANVNNNSLLLKDITQLVIDEADLVLSYGYEDDIQALATALPRGIQTILMSATLTTEVDTLKGLFCRNPAILKLHEKEDEGAGVSQFAVRYVQSMDPYRNQPTDTIHILFPLSPPFLSLTPTSLFLLTPIVMGIQMR